MQATLPRFADYPQAHELADTLELLLRESPGFTRWDEPGKLLLALADELNCYVGEQSQTELSMAIAILERQGRVLVYANGRGVGRKIWQLAIPLDRR